jgi:hypothetical protein
MATMTEEKRNEVNRSINSRAIRVSIYDVGILLGLLFAADKSHGIIPGYESFIQYAAIGMWVYLIFRRYEDWRAMKHSEELITEQDIKQILEN